MGLSVQSINKWRHGHNLPDIENMFILSRILGIKVDNFLVPLSVSHRMIKGENEKRQDSVSMLFCLREYAARLKNLIKPMSNYNVDGI